MNEDIKKDVSQDIKLSANFKEKAKKLAYGALGLIGMFGVGYAAGRVVGKVKVFHAVTKDV